jgi:transcriptional regulator with XRE-family HTH domain
MEQLRGGNTHFDADLSEPATGDRVGTPPVEHRGPSTTEATPQGGGSTSQRNQRLHSDRGDGHDPQCRPCRRTVSSVSSGHSDAPPSAGAYYDDMTNLKTIGRRVRELRKAEGLTQEERAAAIGVTRSTIAGIETGGDRGGIETMIAIADHYKVPMDWLLGRPAPSGSPPTGKLVYRPDQIAILDYWDSLAIDEKKAVVKALRIPVPNDKAA